MVNSRSVTAVGHRTQWWSLAALEHAHRTSGGNSRVPDDRGAIGQSELIENRESWRAAVVTLAILSVAYGSTLLIVVGLRAMELNLGVPRSVLAFAGALTWVGTGLGGIVMGWLADGSASAPAC